MKKFLAMLLTIALMVSMAPVAFAAETTTTYPDVKDGYWGKAAIERWSSDNVVKGFEDNTFHPTDEMTRGQFAQVLCNLLGIDYSGVDVSKNPFTDLKSNKWYAKPVLAVVARGMIKGVSSTEVKPEDNITREQTFVIIGRALGVEPVTDAEFDALVAEKTEFTDLKDIARWAKGYVGALIKMGFIKGMNNGKVEPQGEIQRAAVMQVLANTISAYVTDANAATTAPNGKVESEGGFIVIKSKEAVEISGAADGVVVAPGSEKADVTLDSAVVSGNVKIDAPETTLTVNDSLVKGTVEVSEDADKTVVDVPAGSTVTSVKTEADNVTVTGDGEVKAVEVAAGEGVKVETAKTEVTVDKDAKDVTVAKEDGTTATVEPGKTATTEGEDPVGYQEEEPEEKTFTVTFSIVGGETADTTTVPAKEVKEGEAVESAPAPTKTGYAFDGWYAAEACTGDKVTFPYTPTADVTLYGKWIKTYTVSFDADGGTPEPEAQVVKTGEKAEEPDEPSKAGYEFAGWFVDEDEFDFDTAITEDVELVAGWTWTPVFAEDTAIATNDAFKTAASAFTSAYYNTSKGTANSYIAVDGKADGYEDMSSVWYTATIPFAAAPTDEEYAAAFADATKVEVKLGDEVMNKFIGMSVGNDRWVYGRLVCLTKAGLKVSIPVIALETANSDNQLVFSVSYDGGDATTAVLTVPARDTTAFSISGVTPAHSDTLKVTKDGNKYNVEKADGITAAITTAGWKHGVNVAMTGPATTVDSTEDRTVYFTKKVSGTGHVNYGLTVSESNSTNNVVMLYADLKTEDTTLAYTLTSSERYTPDTVNLVYKSLAAE